MTNSSASLKHRTLPGPAGRLSWLHRFLPLISIGLAIPLLAGALAVWLIQRDLVPLALLCLVAAVFLSTALIWRQISASTRNTALADPAALLYPIIGRLIENPDSSAPFSTLLTTITRRTNTDYASIHLVEEDSGKLTTLSTTDDLLTTQLSERVSMDILTAIERSRHDLVDVSGELNKPGYAAIGMRDNSLLYGFVLIKHNGTGVREQGFLADIVTRLAETVSCTRRARANQRRVVYKERATIARELHDSLAQSLSYLKIQSTRLQTEVDKSLQENSADYANLNNAIDELRTNLNVAYSQLRELMTTFRLTMNGKHLAHAIDDSINEFRQRTNIAFDSDIRISGEELSAQEELQLLQIVREGLSNVVRHSQASRATVSLSEESGRVQLHIADNGVGINTIPNSSQHHGLVIIQERTRRLNGNLFVHTPKKGGTRLEISFASNALKK